MPVCQQNSTGSQRPEISRFQAAGLKEMPFTAAEVRCLFPGQGGMGLPEFLQLVQLSSVFGRPSF